MTEPTQPSSPPAAPPSGEPMSEPSQASSAIAPPPKRPRRVVRTIIVLLLLAGGTTGYFLYRKKQAEKKAEAKKSAAAKRKPRITLVTLAPSRMDKVARRERYVGELVADRVVQLAPKASGRLEGMRKKLGDKVRRNELVAWLDASEIKKQIEEAKAAVTVAKAQVLKAKVELLRAQREEKRKRPLYEQKLLTRQEMENLESAVSVGKAGVVLAQAQVSQARTKIGTLKVMLENTRVYSSIRGRVNQRYVEPGTMVTPATPIYQIVTDHKLLARFKVPERDLKEVVKGKKVFVSVEAYPGRTFEGKVIRVSPAVEASTRTAIAEASLSTYKGRLKPGMFARVEVVWSVAEHVVLVQRRAVIRPPDDPNAPFGVYVYDRGTARFTPVQVGAEHGAEVEIKGLPPGREVVVEGQHGLKTGDLIKAASAVAKKKGSSPGPARPPRAATPKPPPPKKKAARTRRVRRSRRRAKRRAPRKSRSRPAKRKSPERPAQASREAAPKG